MRRSLGTAFLVILLTNVPLALGVPDGAVILPLDEAINKAMTANHHIQSLEAGTKAKEGQAQSEKNRWLGELMLRGGVALHGDDTLIRPITQEMLESGPANMPFDDQFAFWSLAYRIPIYGGGSVSGTRESARLTASASNMATRRSILGIRHQVLVTYVDILSLDAQMAAWQAQKEALDSLVGHIEMGQEAGKYSRVDLLKTKVEQQNVIMKAQSLKLGRNTRYAALMALLGEDQSAAIQYELAPVEYGDFQFTLPPAAALVDSALSNRGDLQAMKDISAAQRANAGVVSGSRLPQVSIGGNFSGSHGGTIDFDDTYWSVNATVSIPLLDMGRRKNLSAKADLTARSAELDVLDMEDRIRAEVAAVMAAVDNAKSNIVTQQATLELATEVNRLEGLRYDSGRGDIDNLLKSKSGKSMAEASLAEARHNLLIALNSLQLTIEGECR
jgi:outer membrane protein TolC